MAALFPFPMPQAIASVGILSGAKLYAYAAGTLTPLDTYDDTGATNQNPVEANAAGYFNVRFDGSKLYKLILKTSADVTIWTQDNVGFTADGMSYLPPGAGAVRRTVQSRLRDKVSVKDYGATGDGVADDFASVQAAMTYGGASDKTVEVPSSRYLIKGDLQITDDQFVMRGEGMAKSHLLAGAGCDRMFRFADMQFAYCEMSGLQFEGGGTAKNAIYATSLAQSVFEKLYVSGFSAVDDEGAIYIGGAVSGDSACNAFRSLVVASNLGHGIRLNGNSNAAELSDIKVFANGYSGIVAGSSEVITINGLTSELNKRTGAFLTAGVNNFTVNGGYNLSNAHDGHDFTTPAVNVKADYIINGSSLASISAASPCTGVRLVNHVVNTAYATQDCFCFAPGAADIHLDQIHTNPASPGYNTMPLLCLYWSTSFTHRAPKIYIGHNDGFGKAISFLGVPIPAGVLAISAKDIRIKGVDSHNFAELDMTKWTNVASAAAAMFERAPNSAEGDLVMRLITTAGGTSHVFGFTVNAADHANNIGKYFEFSCDVQVDATDKGAHLYVATGFAESGNDSTAARQRKSGVFPWPASGLLTFGVAKTGAATSGYAQPSNPVLCEVGADQYALRAAIPRNRKDFEGTAIPTTGTWPAGARIAKTNAAAAGTPGYLCLTNGTFSAATDNTGDTDGSTAVVTGVADTSDFFVGEYVSCSAGFATTGPFRILSKTSSTMTLDTNSNAAQSNITVASVDPTFGTRAVMT